MRTIDTVTLITLLEKKTTTSSQLACVVTLLGGDYSKSSFEYTSSLGTDCLLTFNIKTNYPYWAIYTTGDYSIVARGDLVNDY